MRVVQWRRFAAREANVNKVSRASVRRRRRCAGLLCGSASSLASKQKMTLRREGAAHLGAQLREVSFVKR